MLVDRDRDILLTLTHKTRVLTLPQVARTWWTPTAAGARGARDRLRAIAADGWLERRRMLVHPELELEAPVITWEPGQPEPDLGAASHRLRSRWTGEPESTTIYTATRRAANNFGAPPSCSGPPRAIHQVAHDVHMAAVYLHFREADPETAAAWKSDSFLAASRRSEKRPDAVIQGPDRTGRTGRTRGTGCADRLAIEFGGAYGVPRLRAFHLHCSSSFLPYELW